MIQLRGAAVGTRAVGDFNQLRSPVPGSSGTMDEEGIIQYPGTTTIAVKGGYHIWPAGYSVRVEIDGGGGIHLFAPHSVKPRVRFPFPSDKVVASFTSVQAPVATIREREVGLL